MREGVFGVVRDLVSLGEAQVFPDWLRGFDSRRHSNQLVLVDGLGA
jgi:hypothetical protein